MLGQTALQKERALLGIDASSEPIDHHFIHRSLNHFGVFIMRGQRMPIGHKIEALHLALQAYPIFQSAMVMA